MDDHEHDWRDVIRSKGERVTFTIECHICGAEGVES